MRRICAQSVSVGRRNAPLPADDATAIGEWNLDDDNALVTVETAGDQWRNGCVDRYINVTGRLGTRRNCHDFFSLANGPLESEHWVPFDGGPKRCNWRE